MLESAFPETQETMTSSGRVLVVDDEPHVRELLRDFLTGHNTTMK
jgi:CheY-like chemotaxis protein